MRASEVVAEWRALAKREGIPWAPFEEALRVLGRSSLAPTGLRDNCAAEGGQSARTAQEEHPLSIEEEGKMKSRVHHAQGAESEPCGLRTETLSSTGKENP